jgi:hypothetical protein
MVLVRRTELACRKDWDNDLWEPADEAAPISGQDVELASASRSALPASRSLGLPGVDGAHPPRQGNQRAMARLLDDDSDDFVMPHAPITRERAGSKERPERPSGPAFQRASDPGTRREPLDSPARDLRDLSNAWGSGLSHLGRPRAEAPVPYEPNAGRDSDNVGRVDRPEERKSPPSPRPVPAAPTSPPDVAGRFGAMAAEFVTESPRGPVPQSGRTEPIELPEDELDEEEDDVGDVEEDEPEELDAAARSGERAETKGEHPSIELLDRCCRTCRDFLPTENGGRGVCNNAHALTKGQFVDPEELACQGTFGNWWAPSDDWWRARADISHHYAPTPLVDELVKEIRARHAHGKPQGSTHRRSRP